MHRLRGGMSMIKNLMQKLLLLVQKLMILLLKLKCTSEGVQQRQKIKKKGRGFPEEKFTTHDEEEKEEESSDPRVYTPSQSEPSDNEENVDVAQSEYTEEEEVNAERTYEEEDANDLYRDPNVNLEGRDADMTDAPQTTQVIEDTHVTLTLVNPEGHQQSS
ncbi:hypothetical protein Tco_0834603 [Tanacetum coccineum]